MYFRHGIIFSVLSLLLAGPIFAQPGNGIEFVQDVKDFGKIQESDGVVSYRFEFINSTAKPLVVKQVQSSCGCTSPDWTKEPIQPGGNGYVDIKFDPHNRPGPFDKTLKVSFVDNNAEVQLRIIGFVVPSPSSIEEEFPISVGKLRIKNRFLNLGNISAERMYSKSFDIYNQGDSSLFFSDEIVGGDHVTIAFEPFTLPPKSRGKLWVHYDVKQKGDLGYFREDITVFTDEPTEARKNLVITVTIMDTPTAKVDTGPRIMVSETMKDFGIKQQGDTVSVVYQLQNQGNRKLQIRKAFTSCNCIRVQVDDDQIGPGKVGEIRVTFLTHQRVGNQQKSVTVFTNDPAQPVTVLSLKGLLRGPKD